MGRARSWGVLSLLAASLAGCAAITGLGDLQEDPTLEGDAGSDATAGDARPDAAAPHDAAGDHADAPVEPPDATMDDGGADAPVDAGVDAPPVDCGPTDTVANCTGCGLACDTVHSADASCNGVTCTYAACAPGHLDCNAAAPDTNGCECATPFCCGTACADQHSNGVGGFFYDCVARGTYNAPQAQEACASFTMDPSQCTTTLACDDAGALAICDTPSKTNCICWGYSGANVGGRVAQSVPNPDGGLAACRCPTSASPTWN